MKVLVLAYSARNIVCSAKKAGYTVIALDRLGDVDTCKCADKAITFQNMPVNELQQLADSLGDFDAVVLGHGFEKLKFKNTLNNPQKVIEEVSDKSKIPKKFQSMDIPHPETTTLDKASNFEFPLMVKPKFGSSGMRNVIVRNENELALFSERCDANEFIVQEFVEGIPCSTSIISNGDDAVVVALNEQLIGVPWLTKLPFAYCGNITPFYTKFNNKMIQYSKQIALEFKLLGTNGIDFILTKKGAVAIEVNPRFQSSQDVVELSAGINIFDAHIESFVGKLPQLKRPLCFAGKAILYASEKVAINHRISDALIEFMDKGKAVDVPQLGVVAQPDERITTIIETGKTRQIVFEKLRKSASYLKNIMEA